MRLALVTAWFLVVAGPTGCNCDPDRVTFREDAGPGSTAVPARRPDAGRAPAAPSEGNLLPEGTTQLAVEGAGITAPPETSIRLLLPADADGDGDRDALHVVADARGTAELRYARRDGTAFGASRALVRLPSPASCRYAGGSARTLPPAHALIRIDYACTPPNQQPAIDPPTHGPVHLILALADPPRVLEQLTVLDPLGRAPGELAIDARALDHDGDSRTDVVVTVSVTSPGATEPARVEIPWLDRPAGLARDTREPEQTIAAIADAAAEQARPHLRAKVAPQQELPRIVAAASQAVALHRALCRETGEARLRVGDGDGLPCRASRGAGRANALLVQALAEQRRYTDALAAYARLRGPGVSVADRDRNAATERLTKVAQAPRATREGPAVTLGAGDAPRVHTPFVTFFDDARAVVRGRGAQFVDVATGAATPIDGPIPDLLVRDPQNRFAVTDIQRTCEGYVLSIVRVQSIVGSVVAERPISEPLLEARPPPGLAGGRCTLPATVRNDDGGWRILGWAPQGIVAARMETVRIVPLDAEARQAGTATELTPGTPPPAPLPSGAITPTGSAYVIPVPLGVLVRRLTPTPETLFIRAPGEGDITSAAISPNGRHLAIVRSGRTHLLDL